MKTKTERPKKTTRLDDEPTISDAAGRLYVVLARLSRALRRRDPLPIGHSSVSALAVISEHGPLRIGDLAIREGVSAPAMTRMITVLDEAGYTHRKPDPEDRRACLIHITDKGRRFIHGARSARSAALLDRIGRLPAARQKELMSALTALELLASDEG